jgi:hypothetical protein
MSADFIQIIFLSPAKGDVVAICNSLGNVVGEFKQTLEGKIYFCHQHDKNSRWLYVNESMTSFRRTAAIFNRFCKLHADENLDDDRAWKSAATQLRSDLEQIEPLGDPETSLWGATVHDTSVGLLTLY